MLATASTTIRTRDSDESGTDGEEVTIVAAVEVPAAGLPAAYCDANDSFWLLKLSSASFLVVIMPPSWRFI